MHRFINQDPIGIWGDANNLGNGFAYVAGMVIEGRDPEGLNFWAIFNRNMALKVGADAHDYTQKGGGSNELANTAYVLGVDGYNLRMRVGEVPSNIDKTFEGLAIGLHIGGFFTNFFSSFFNNPDDGQNDWVDTGETGELTIFETDEEGNEVVHVLGYKKEKNNKTGQTRYVYEDGTVVTEDENGNQTCEGPSCGDLGFERPADPDNIDGIQSFFANQLLKKMLKSKMKSGLRSKLEKKDP